MNDMDDINIRGGLPVDAPLELTGEFTGYSTGATMQIGLWIRNDSDYIRGAHNWAELSGTRPMAEYLIKILRRSGRYSPPGQTFWAVQSDETLRTQREVDMALFERVDWAQIAYDLIGSEPTDEELALAQRDIGEGVGEFGMGDEDSAFTLASRRRAERVRRWVLEGQR